MQIGVPTLGRLLEFDPQPRTYYENPPEGYDVVAVVARADHVVSAMLATTGQDIPRTKDSRVLYFTITKADLNKLGPL